MSFDETMSFKVEKNKTNKKRDKLKRQTTY